MFGYLLCHSCSCLILGAGERVSHTHQHLLGCHFQAFLLLPVFPGTTQDRWAHVRSRSQEQSSFHGLCPLLPTVGGLCPGPPWSFHGVPRHISHKLTVILSSWSTSTNSFLMPSGLEATARVPQERCLACGPLPGCRALKCQMGDYLCGPLPAQPQAASVHEDGRSFVPNFVSYGHQRRAVRALVHSGEKLLQASTQVLSPWGLGHILYVPSLCLRGTPPPLS